MKKTAQQIAHEIKHLVTELVTMASGARRDLKEGSQQPVRNTTKGASGALSILTSEGFFDEPRELAAVMARLQEIGRHYPKNTVSMNLLNLARRRALTRIKGTKTKRWQYVVRK
jgi:hypothetical protein